MEEMAHARARGAEILAEVRGFGTSGDAQHIVQPPSHGHGAALAMQRALHGSGLTACDVNYINAHATSTPLGDPVELKAISKVRRVPAGTHHDLLRGTFDSPAWV